MPLPTSSTISLSDVRSVLALTTGSISLGDIRSGSTASWLLAPSLEGYPSTPNLGSRIYFAGGTGLQPGTGTSVPHYHISRLITSTNTVEVINSLFSTSRNRSGAVASSTRGYYCGGNTGSSTGITEINYIDFATEALTVISNTLPEARRQTASLSSSSAGYLCGGTLTTSTDTIVKFTFSSEIAANMSITLASVGNSAAGTGDSTKGYIAGRTDNSFIEKLTYSTEAVVNTSITLAVGRNALASCTSSTKAYFLAGTTNDSNTGAVGEIDGLVYSTESTINPSATVTARGGATGGESSTAGYVTSGFSTLFRSTGIIDTLDFSTDTTSYIQSSGLWNHGWGATALSNKAIQSPSISFSQLYSYNPQGGYIIGGAGNSGVLSGIDKFIFATEKMQSLATSLPVATTGLTASSFGVNNYVAGGYTTANTDVIRKLSGTTETLTTLTAVLVVPRTDLASVSPINDYPTKRIYFVGGSTGSYSSEVEVLRTDTEAVVDVSTTLLGGARAGVSGLSDKFIGYLAGGYDGTWYNRVEYMLFSAGGNTMANLTTSLGGRSNSATLTGFKDGVGSGYIVGGYNSGGYTATTEKIAFESRTFAGSISASLTGERAGAGGLSGALKGYITGGENNSGYLTGTETFTFNTESYGSSSSSLSTAKAFFGCSQSSN